MKRATDLGYVMAAALAGLAIYCGTFAYQGLVHGKIPATSSRAIHIEELTGAEARVYGLKWPSALCSCWRAAPPSSCSFAIKTSKRVGHNVDSG
jgi:hypothetical protein